jgi:hypothetical protein
MVQGKTFVEKKPNMRGVERLESHGRPRAEPETQESKKYCGR